jgi:predicted permease
METLEQRLAAIPGVKSVGAIDILPLSGEDARRNVVIEDREPVPDSPTRMHPRSVTPSYFHAAGMTILRGRGFGAGDRADAPLVSVINETAANRFWPGQDPIGKHWRFNQPDAKWSTIVGVAADVRHWGLRTPANPMVFAPLEQQMSGAMTFVVETPVSAPAFAASARQAVHAFDPNIPVGNLQTFDDVVATSLQSPRSITLLMSIFGGLALLLAALGIYGVMSQLVASRAQEIGVRTALGARPGHIVTHFLAGCAWQTGVGVLIGGTAGAALIGATPMLFGVKPTDPATLAAVAATIFGASFVACLFPVARALRIDPIAAIRE